VVVRGKLYFNLFCTNDRDSWRHHSRKPDNFSLRSIPSFCCYFGNSHPSSLLGLWGTRESKYLIISVLSAQSQHLATILATILDEIDECRCRYGTGPSLGPMSRMRPSFPCLPIHVSSDCVHACNTSIIFLVVSDASQSK
jgi:hypothetical protein